MTYGQRKNFFELKKVLLIQKCFLWFKGIDLFTLKRKNLNQQNFLQFKEIFSLTIYQRNLISDENVKNMNSFWGFKKTSVFIMGWNPTNGQLNAFLHKPICIITYGWKFHVTGCVVRTSTLHNYDSHEKGWVLNRWEVWASIRGGGREGGGVQNESNAFSALTAIGRVTRPDGNRGVDRYCDS